MIVSICCYFNWDNNQVRKNNYIKFRKNFQYPLKTIEICLKESDFFIDDSTKIIASPDNILWQKERAFNLLLENLDEKYDKILWVDTDILFQNSGMMQELESKLDQYDIVQPFETVMEYRDGIISENNCLNTDGYAKTLKDYTEKKELKCIQPAFGLTWAINRSIMPNGYFYDEHILGSSDLLQIQSVTLDILNKSFIGKYSDNIVRSWINYCKKMPKKKYDIGYCYGSIEHFYHGKESNRGYKYRECLLNKYGFDPQLHLAIDDNGLYKIIYPELEIAISNYFNKRNLATTLEP